MLTKTPSSPSQAHLIGLEEELENIKLEEWKEKEEEAKQAPITDDELERFRREWREEVLAKRAGGHDARARGDRSNLASGPKSTDLNSSDPASKSKPFEPILSISTSPIKSAVKSPPPIRRPLSVDVKTSTAGPSRAQIVPPPGKIGKIPFRNPRVQDKDRAVQLYGRAVESEQSGKLNDALMLYRKAFKLDDGVDRTYARSQASLAAKVSEAKDDVESSSPSSSDVVSSAAPVDEPYSFQRHIQVHPDYERSALPSLGLESQTPAQNSTLHRHSPLTTLLRSLPIQPSDTVFLPAEEELPLPLSKLPAELIDPILSHLDVASIEKFGSTCWRARYLTAGSRIWKTIAEGIYKNPAIYPEERGLGDLAKRHGGEWRTTLVEEERVRMDGCYISVCHYVRPGAGEEWVTITHLITYHRYLRFYPDGSVISFLTTDHPSDVVPMLRPSLRAKGLHFGRWRLIRSDEIDVPLDAQDPFADPLPPARKDDSTTGPKKTDKKRAQILITELLEPGTNTPKYEFEMELGLRETGRGRWNKLNLSSYHSINLATGESLALSLKHQKPFYFSKVKSYNPPL